MVPPDEAQQFGDRTFSLNKYLCSFFVTFCHAHCIWLTPMLTKPEKTSWLDWLITEPPCLIIWYNNNNKAVSSDYLRSDTWIIKKGISSV